MKIPIVLHVVTVINAAAGNDNRAELCALSNGRVNLSHTGLLQLQRDMWRVRDSFYFPSTEFKIVWPGSMQRRDYESGCVTSEH